MKKFLIWDSKYNELKKEKIFRWLHLIIKRFWFRKEIMTVNEFFGPHRSKVLNEIREQWRTARELTWPSAPSKFRSIKFVSMPGKST